MGEVLTLESLEQQRAEFIKQLGEAEAHRNRVMGALEFCEFLINEIKTAPAPEDKKDASHIQDILPGKAD